jgi:hypothetical protein
VDMMFAEILKLLFPSDFECLGVACIAFALYPISLVGAELVHTFQNTFYNCKLSSFSECFHRNSSPALFFLVTLYILKH